MSSRPFIRIEKDLHFDFYLHRVQMSPDGKVRRSTSAPTSIEFPTSPVDMFNLVLVDNGIAVSSWLLHAV